MEYPMITIDAPAYDSDDNPFDERSSHTHLQSPHRYASRIEKYAERAANVDIHSGAAYRGLAAFLNKPYAEASKDVRVEVLDHSKPPLAHAHSVREDENPSSNVYPTVTDARRFLRNPPALAARSAHIVWLSGNPAPDWCNAVGSQYRVDPEYFRRHLNFLQNRENCDITILPSSVERMVTLRLTTICRRPIALNRAEIEQHRMTATESVQTHQQLLQTGDSVVRKYTVFDHTIFTLEQDISIYVERGKQHDGWAATVCSDFGIDLTKGSTAPWNDTPGPGIYPPCDHVNVHLPKLALERPPTQASTCMPLNNRSSMAQNAIHLADHAYLKAANNAPRQDIRETLHDLFAFTAAAEGQFLTMLEGLIDRELQVQSREAQTEWTLTNLRFFKSSVDDHIVRLESLLSFLKRPEIPRWSANSPSASSSHRGSPSPDARSPRLLNSGQTYGVYQNSQLPSLSDDFAHILQHAKRLSVRCVQNTTALVNMAMLEESKKAIIQADGMKRLTLLAFFFLPLSLATSFFGMNFLEFGTGSLSIWVFFAFAFPLVSISTVVCFWESVSKRFRRQLNWAKTHYK